MPSDPANFHVYEVSHGILRRIASCEADGLGRCLEVLFEEGQITPETQVGILRRDADVDRGDWLANPFAGRKY